jgi:hypothetical protein
LSTSAPGPPKAQCASHGCDTLANGYKSPGVEGGKSAVRPFAGVSPLSAILFAEILHDAGVPPGVFNLVNGDGPTVGEAISRHRRIDMVSTTMGPLVSRRRLGFRVIDLFGFPDLVFLPHRVIEREREGFMPQNDDPRR